MKKILSVLLAVMMLVLPVVSSADGFALEMVKRISEGCEVTQTTTMEAGEALKSMVGDAADLIAELFESLGIQTRMQMIDNHYQGGLTLLLSGEPAAGITAAKTGDSILLTSDLIGNDVCAVSYDEIVAAMEKAEMPEEARNSTRQMLDLFFGKTSVDTPAFAFNEEDIQTVMEQMLPKLQTILAGVKLESCDAAGLLLSGTDVTEGVCITVTGEQLSQFVDLVLEAVAELLQKSAKEAGADLTEIREQVKTALSKSLKEDVRIRVLSGEKDQLIAIDTAIAANETTLKVCLEIAVQQNDKQIILQSATRLTTGEDGSVDMRGTLMTDVASYIAGNATVDATINGETRRILETNGTLSYAEAGNLFSSQARLMYKVDAGTESVCFRLENDSKGQYDDETMNMESVNKIYLTENGADPLLIINNNTAIGLAEAYLTDENAIHVLSMDREQQAQQLQKWQETLTQKLPEIIQKLPASIQMLLSMMFNQ